jgi:hypothetical protein
LLIASAAPSAARSRQRWRDKHQVRSRNRSLVGRRFVPVEFIDGGQHRPAHNHNDDKAGVQGR